MKPLVSIIIVNWNGGDIFQKCIESLGEVTYPNWELIVVDNGSTEKLLKLPKNTKIIKNSKNSGFAPANNQGVKSANGKYVLLLNNDTLVEKNFLNIMVDKMESEDDLGVIQPKIKIMDNPKLLDNCGSFLTNIGFLHHIGFMKKDSKEYNIEKEVFSVKGACMLIRKKLIDKVGLFDDEFVSYFEETDFCWKSWLLNYRVIYLPNTYILHKVGFTIKRLDVANINFHYYKNRITSLIKNLSISKLMFILPIHLVISLGISFTFLIRGQFTSSLLILKAILWNIINLNDILKKRSKIQKIRTVSDTFIFDKLSVPINWNIFFGDFKRVEKDISKKSN